MAVVRVQLNHAGVRDLLNDPGVVADLEARGDRVLAQARSTAPVVSGAYRDSLQAWTDTGARARVKVGSDLDYAPLIESRTGNLARSLDAAGGI